MCELRNSNISEESANDFVYCCLSSNSCLNKIHVFKWMPSKAVCWKPCTRVGRKNRVCNYTQRAKRVADYAFCCYILHLAWNNFKWFPFRNYCEIHYGLYYRSEREQAVVVGHSRLWTHTHTHTFLIRDEQVIFSIFSFFASEPPAFPSFYSHTFAHMCFSNPLFPASSCIPGAFVCLVPSIQYLK